MDTLLQAFMLLLSGGLRRFVLVTIAVAISACDNRSTEFEAHGPQTGFMDALEAHSALFAKDVIRVTDGVYVAIGFGLANAIMIEGDQGIVVVDTMETMEQAREVMAAFRTITAKPVAAIIYTHNHTDHIFGAAAIAEGREVPVYAHSSTARYINRLLNQVRPVISARSMRMFGTHLPEGHVINNGIGPRLAVDATSSLFALPPTHTFDERLRVSLAGIEMELVHAPGETNDQLYVWLPKHKTVLSGDNIYQAFPNLYTIRGTAYRDVLAWATSLDTIRQLGAEYLVPSHGRPVQGVDVIDALLGNYSDAIRFVHDQTLRFMNKGLTPDQIVERISLPTHLRQHPWLQEFYGKVSWSVRAVFDGYLGWFDGNPASLQPLSDGEQARHMAALAGGSSALLQHAQTALGAGDAQWALQLSDYLGTLNPEDPEVNNLRASALEMLGRKEVNPNARYYYLSSALEAREALKPGIKTRPSKDFLATLSIEQFLHAMPALLKAEETLEQELALGFHFRDSGKTFTLTIRRGVARVQPGLNANRVATIRTSEPVWKAIAAGLDNLMLALASSNLDIDGDKWEAFKVLSFFEASD